MIMHSFLRFRWPYQNRLVSFISVALVCKNHLLDIDTALNSLFNITIIKIQLKANLSDYKIISC
ncbi:hypothetical protein BHC47_08305 [Snodgrassella alvi]|uniref:Uncharacterized protein n=1 Tax=Snodgrassella alvi TaxID=1196083 RepID=A0A2N9Y1X4_9NEIS|nr:hypothetical protein BHC47_08305 [Snodgrassella alvi]PIT61594.1 hypothetical protein BHC56_00940 [Snodgrassella alvi]